MGKKIIRGTMLVAFLGLAFVVRPALAQPAVSDGFTIEMFASVPNPIAVAFPPAGSSFTAFMYVSGDGESGGACPGPGPQHFVDDKIFAVSSTGGVTEFATLPGESDVTDLSFPPPISRLGLTEDNLLRLHS